MEISNENMHFYNVYQGLKGQRVKVISIFEIIL